MSNPKDCSTWDWQKLTRCKECDGVTHVDGHALSHDCEQYLAMLKEWEWAKTQPSLREQYDMEERKKHGSI